MVAGRKREFNEEEVLECAASLFKSRGYTATTTEDLLGAMNINKGSLYNSFGSKRELFISVLNYYSDKYVSGFILSLEKSKDPIAAIKNSFLDVAKRETEVSKSQGCFLGNTVMEQASLDEDLQAIAADMLKRLEMVYYKHIKNALAAGSLKTKQNPRLLARHLTNLWNGIHLTARMYSSPKELLPLIKMNLDLLY